MSINSLKLIVLLGIVGLSSCTITKRYHSFGYHIETKFPVQLTHKGAEQQAALKKTQPRECEKGEMGERIESIKGINITTKSSSVLNVDFQRPLLLSTNRNLGVNGMPGNRMHKEELSSPSHLTQVDETHIAAKKQVKIKDETGKKRYLGLKGLLMILLGFFVIGATILANLFLVAEIWAYVLVFAGLLMIIMGLVYVLYAFFNWLFYL